MVTTTSVVSVMEVLARMEQVVASRVGAGKTVAEAWDAERWRRQMRRELAAHDVDELVERIRTNLSRARTPRDVHAVFGQMRARLIDLVG